jgi:hypothetical protein
MSSGTETERCWTTYSGVYSSLSLSNKILVPRASISMFSHQVAPSGVANQFQQHGLKSALSSATYIILTGMSVVGASVQWMNLEIVSLMTSNTPSGITLYIERLAIPTPRQPMPNSCRTIFTEDSTCFVIFPVLPVTFLSPTYAIQYRSACLATSRCRFSTSWRRMNSLTSTMQSRYLCLLTTTSQQKSVIWSSFSIEWEGYEGNELLPSWSCNQVSTRRKPYRASNI